MQQRVDLENHIKKYLVAAIVDDYNNKSETLISGFFHSRWESYCPLMQPKRPDITLMKLQSDFLGRNYLNVMDLSKRYLNIFIPHPATFGSLCFVFTVRQKFHRRTNRSVKHQSQLPFFFHFIWIGR